MPSAETVKKALAQISKRSANHDYFFSKLNSSDWIEPLDQAGLFSAPPAAVREGDTISFPLWPESQYLARVASDAPEQVTAIMMKTPVTDNMRVHDDFARAATKLPADLAAKWAQKEKAWIEKQEYLYLLFPGSLGELIVYLARSGKQRESLALAKAVMSVKLVENESNRTSIRLDPWDYGQLLQKHFPEILRHTGQEGFTLLCDLLGSALIKNSNEYEDYSWIWRPAIEPHEQNTGADEVRDNLVDAIRDGSKQLIQDGHDLYEILQVLLDHKTPIFKRLALHLLAENHTHPAAKNFACDRENFLNERLRHEFNQLLKVVFSDLDEQAKSSILAWIEEGPPHEEDSEDIDKELRRKQKAHWQAQRLFGLYEQLPEKWKQHYSEIVSEVGEPEHPDFSWYTTTTWAGPTSPKQGNELEAMSADDIASFLKNWEPSNTWQKSGPEPEPEGLGRVLQSIVAKSPERFVESIDLFRDIDSTYVRAIVQGFNEAVKAGHAIEWAAIIEYLTWIAEQPRSQTRKFSGRLDHDPHWGWARKAVVNLLSMGFEKNLIDFSLRAGVWPIIDTIADDPDPTPEDDEKSTMDPATRSINTTRGETLHAVMQYALWVRRKMTEEEATPKHYTFDMESIPEVRERLERHLDHAIEPSTAIRAVFGQWFPWLLVIDDSWTKAKVDTIFPVDNPLLRDAAWHTYLAFCRVYNEPFQVLRDQYSASVDRLQCDRETKSSSFGRPGEWLGTHLMVLIGRGMLAWSDEDALVRRFFDNASISDASHAVAFVGQSLRNESPVPDDVLERFRDLWEQLANHVLKDARERMQMLKPFGWWFVSGRFELK